MAGVKKVVCPHCKKEPSPSPSPKLGEGRVGGVNSFWPFCSERCKLLDLGKWASGQYSIPGEHISKEEDEDDEEKNNVD